LRIAVKSFRSAGEILKKAYSSAPTIQDSPDRLFRADTRVPAVLCRNDSPKKWDDKEPISGSALIDGERICVILQLQLQVFPVEVGGRQNPFTISENAGYA